MCVVLSWPQQVAHVSMPCSRQPHRITVHCFILHRLATLNLVGPILQSMEGLPVLQRPAREPGSPPPHASLGPVCQVGCVAKWEGNRNAPHTKRWEKTCASVWGLHVLLTKSLAHGGLMTLSSFWLSAELCHPCHVRHSLATVWQGGWAHKILHIFPLAYSTRAKLSDASPPTPWHFVTCFSVWLRRSYSNLGLLTLCVTLCTLVLCPRPKTLSC